MPTPVCLKNKHFSLCCRGPQSVLAPRHIDGPVAGGPRGVVDEVDGAGHVVLPVALAHVVLGAVIRVLVVAHVTVAFITRHHIR